MKPTWAGILITWTLAAVALALVILPGGWKLAALVPPGLIVACWVAGCVLARLDAYQGRHAPQDTDPGPGDMGSHWPGVGSMQLDDEKAYKERKILRATRRELVPPYPVWNRSTTESGADWDHRYALYNGHTWGCLTPDKNHPGACPEEGDWPDDDYPGNLPDLPPADPALDDERARLVDAALAFEAGHPEDAGWTDQLLADLHDAPTALDELPPAGRAGAGADNYAQPDHSMERLAGTGEIELAALRAEYAADIRAQYDEHTEYLSRMVTEVAEYRLHASGLT